MSKLSVVITAYNEEKKIEDCLKSVADMADEIVVVDNDSTDKTAEIARKYTDHVYHQKNNPKEIDLQKNFGFEKASGDWILSLDADERVTEVLAGEIKETLSKTEPHPDPLLKGEGANRMEGIQLIGYFIPRKNIIFGKWIEHTGWYPDHQLRLFQRGMGRYVSRHYHEPIKINGEVGYLQEDLIHYNYESIAQFLRRNLFVYAPNEAESLLHKGEVFEWQNVIRLFVKEFLSRYFARKGYKDGLHGLVLSLLMGFYHLMIFCYMWEKKGFIEVPGDQLSVQLEKELLQSERDVRYWLHTIKLEKERNPVKKTILKVKKKMFKHL